MRTLLLMSALMLVASTIGYSRGNEGWRGPVVIEGTYTPIESSQRRPGEMPFACYPPCDARCAVVVWIPNPDNRLTGSTPKPEDRSGYWIPSLHRGYADVRFNGAIADPLTQAIVYSVSETSRTKMLGSEEELLEWAATESK